jgi:hypothetical protein
MYFVAIILLRIKAIYNGLATVQPSCSNGELTIKANL